MKGGTAAARAEGARRGGAWMERVAIASDSHAAVFREVERRGCYVCWRMLLSVREGENVSLATGFEARRLRSHYNI